MSHPDTRPPEWHSFCADLEQEADRAYPEGRVERWERTRAKRGTPRVISPETRAAVAAEFERLERQAATPQERLRIRALAEQARRR